MTSSGKTIRVETKINATLDDDQKRRIAGMVYGNGHFDREFQYTDRKGDTHNLAVIHFTKDPNPYVIGGETTLLGVGNIRFDHDIYIYLEDDTGHLTGMNAASSKIKSQHHTGVIFQDEGGRAWFCGTQDILEDKVTGSEPLLFQIATTGFTELVPDETGHDLFDRPASIGEFWISSESLPVVTSVPWQAGFAEPIMNHENSLQDPQPEFVAQERAALDRMLERTKNIEITVAGKTLQRIGDRVEIHGLADRLEGDLYELTNTTAVMPQYFCRLDDGRMRDLRDDNYSVIALGDPAQSDELEI